MMNKALISMFITFSYIYGGFTGSWSGKIEMEGEVCNFNSLQINIENNYLKIRSNLLSCNLSRGNFNYPLDEEIYIVPDTFGDRNRLDVYPYLGSMENNSIYLKEFKCNDEECKYFKFLELNIKDEFLNVTIFNVNEADENSFVTGQLTRL